MPRTLFLGHSFFSRLQMALECVFSAFGPVVLARGGALLDSFDSDLNDLSQLVPGKIFICLLDNEIFTSNGWRRHRNLYFILETAHLGPPAEISVPNGTNLCRFVSLSP